MYEGNGDDLLALDASLVDKLHHFDHIAALRCLAEVRYFQVRQVTLVYDGRAISVGMDSVRARVVCSCACAYARVRQ